MTGPRTAELPVIPEADMHLEHYRQLVIWLGANRRKAGLAVSRAIHGRATREERAFIRLYQQRDTARRYERKRREKGDTA